ncbi:hypothetical protein PPERSA_01093 [Pseudocohnilembus persalinus]|uniref:Uncharacterized protein n=1 Tax=Pseudocohnilembus persalinus TaxID=266149 RepID=A0A0V0QUN2_PSEPJ|nr:hypothetical protein PPERSA_01093 [Pseudocohnilembus persalinus]|eukprot:KRX06015.1 hypothetical protein PPERSA_01093 [Pseudocohnilembus persalinus]
MSILMEKQQFSNLLSDDNLFSYDMSDFVEQKDIFKNIQQAQRKTEQFKDNDEKQQDYLDFLRQENDDSLYQSSIKIKDYLDDSQPSSFFFSGNQKNYQITEGDVNFVTKLEQKQTRESLNYE